ncbi:MAG: hypothetical protein AB1782_15535, partial [Cyanobacteriota bacterium]
PAIFNTFNTNPAQCIKKELVNLIGFYSGNNKEVERIFDTFLNDTNEEIQINLIGQTYYLSQAKKVAIFKQFANNASENILSELADRIYQISEVNRPEIARLIISKTSSDEVKKALNKFIIES